MENHCYSSYPDSHDSSPRSREIECENASLAWDEPQQAAFARVKLMCSYGGRIQPRPHDNQLSYVGGETKILAVDRSIRFPAFLARLTALLPGGAAAATEDVCFKYQLPGEDLDALISVTNDEDLEHMMLEYDRLLRPAAKPATRLRIFLFPLAGAPAVPEQKPERQWFVDALNSVPALQPPPQVETNPLPPHAPASAGPDYLFGLDTAVKVKDPAPEPTVQETLTVEVPVRTDLDEKDDRQIGGEQVVSPAEIQRQIQELQRMQIAAENHHHQQQQQQQQAAAGFQRNGSDETLAARAVTGDYYPPRSSEKAQPPSTAQIPAAYWPEQRAVPTSGRYASMAGGDQPFYFIPAAHGMYPGPAAIHPGAYYAAMPRMVPTEAYRDATAVFSMAPPPPQQQQQQTAAQVTGGPYQEAMRVSQQQQTAAQVAGGQYQEAMRVSQQQQTAAQVAGGQYQEAMRVSQQTAAQVAGGQYQEAMRVSQQQQQQQGGAEGAAFPTAQVAYDSSGRAVYYTGAAVPTYQAVTSVGPINPVEGSKVVKTPQVS